MVLIVFSILNSRELLKYATRERYVHANWPRHLEVDDGIDKPTMYDDLPDTEGLILGEISHCHDDEITGKRFSAQTTPAILIVL